MRRSNEWPCRQPGRVRRGPARPRIGLALRWRVAGAISWALLGGAFVGWGTEYAPLFDDPSADPSVGRAAAKALLFGLCMSVYGVMREAGRGCRADQPGAGD